MLPLMDRLLSRASTSVSRQARKADVAVAREGSIILSNRDSQRVVELINNPPELTKGLRVAIEAKYR